MAFTPCTASVSVFQKLDSSIRFGFSISRSSDFLQAITEKSKVAARLYFKNVFIAVKFEGLKTKADTARNNAQCGVLTVIQSAFKNVNPGNIRIEPGVLGKG
jgi:hypothetical protein